MNQRDTRVAAFLFILISSLYFATVAGITSSNDGSHYALVRAIVDKRSFEISEYLSFTENQDYAFHGDRKFSDRPPGTALLAAPIYALAVFLPKPFVMIPSKHDAENPRLIYALVMPVLAASATALILFWILKGYLGLSLWATVVTTLAFAFGTMTWKYGSLLYSHAASGLAVMGTVALLLRWSNKEVDWRAHSSLGFLVGSSVLMEYTNIVFVVLVSLYWIYRTRKQGKVLLAFVSGGLIPAAFLMAYNTLNFGGPLELSTFNVDTSRWPQNTSFFHDFATPIWVGLPAMLFWGNDNQGLFWLAPVSLIGLVGLRGWRRELGLIAGLFVAMLLLFSTSTTFNPYTNDGRYITPFLGLWFVLVGFSISRMQLVSSSSWLSFISPLFLYGLFFISLNNQIMHIAFSWGHDLDLAALRPWSVAPENIAVLWQAVLPNAANLPLWWGLLAVGWLPARYCYRALLFRPEVVSV